MGRLIDADKLKKDIEKWLNPNAYTEEPRMVEVDDIAVSVLMEIEEQPTAYDVNKVVEQLEELKDENMCVNISCLLCKYKDECVQGEMSENVAIDRALEIVKDGGIDG